MYQYELAVAVDGEETTLTCRPDTGGRHHGRVTGQDGQLEYDGLSVETGPLDPEGLSPVSAVPALLEGPGQATSCPARWRRTAPCSVWTVGTRRELRARKRGIPVVRHLYPCPVQRRDIGGRIPGHFM